MLASFVPFKGGANQFNVKARVRLAELFHCLGQINESSRRRLFQYSNRANYGKPATGRRIAPGPVIHQNGIGVDFLRQADCFQFSRVHVQREIR